MSGVARGLPLALALLCAPSQAQFAAGQGPTPPVTRASPAGELWSVSTLQEIYGPRDREPTKRDRQQTMICYARGAVGLNSAANAELPGDLKDKCWLADKRSEARRQQTKYACNDGMSAEVATRQEADGSFGSQVVVNVPEKGGISVTRTMRRVAGTCDPSKPAASVPVPPAPPSK